MYRTLRTKQTLTLRSGPFRPWNEFPCRYRVPGLDPTFRSCPDVLLRFLNLARNQRRGGRQRKPFSASEASTPRTRPAYQRRTHISAVSSASPVVPLKASRHSSLGPSNGLRKNIEEIGYFRQIFHLLREHFVIEQIGATTSLMLHGSKEPLDFTKIVAMYYRF